jgi:pimeloyl-ACP methyl ester carboxylesterase
VDETSVEPAGAHVTQSGGGAGAAEREWLAAPLRAVTVEGCAVRFREIGRPAGSPVLLVHGGGAHTGWWLDVVPRLIDRQRVVVVDLSGHGESGHRSAYRYLTWVDELAAVVEAVGGGPAHVVGHSMGGLVGVHLAGRRPDVVASLTILDSTVVRKEPRRERATRPVKHYPTVAEALTHFHLRPGGTIAPPSRLEAVARIGLRLDEEGWRWRADPLALQYFPREDIDASLRGIRAPIAFAYGEHSELVDRAAPDRVEELTGRLVARRIMAGAFHHLPLDLPEETAAWIDELVRVRFR